MEVNENEIYTPAETEKILKISSSTMTRLIKQGLIRSARIGKQYRILGKEILRMLSPELEDTVGVLYNKGRRWVHDESQFQPPTKNTSKKAQPKKGDSNGNRLEK